MIDALHKWLGIPPEEQPPNHYRLLGISIFESDPDVIDAAADKQLSFLHDMSGGPYAAEAEEIANSVSIARLCLLNEDRKSQYDGSLRADISDSQADPISQQTDLSVSGTGISPTGNVRSRPTRRPLKRMRKRRSPLGLYSSIAAIIAILMILMAVWQGHLVLDLSMFKAKSAGDVPPSANVEVDPNASSAIADQEQTTLSADAVTSPPSPANGKLGSRVPDESTPGQPPGSTGTVDGVAPANAESMAAETSSGSGPVMFDPKRSLADLLKEPDQASEPSVTGSSVTGSSVTGSSVTGASTMGPAVTKSPVPDAESLVSTMALVKDVYRSKYVDAKSKAERIEVARQMHRDGQQTNDDPTGRFALWRVARDIFGRDGDFLDALATVDNLSVFYDGVDVAQLKFETLVGSSAAVDRDEIELFATASIDFAEQAIDERQFGMVVELLDRVLQTSGDSWSRKLSEKAVAIRAKANILQQQYQQFQKAVETLEADEGLSEASSAKLREEIGKFLCFGLSDWDEGLRYLNRGATASIVNAAMTELSLVPSIGQKKNVPLAVADAWYDAAADIESQRDLAIVLDRTLNFYSALVAESEGLSRRKIQKRMDDISNRLKDLPTESQLAGATEEPNSLLKVLDDQSYTSADSRSDFAKRRGDVLTVGMGNRPDGRGEAAMGLELRNVDRLAIEGSASHAEMIDVDSSSKTGFVVDYHTPGGYVKRVFLGAGSGVEKTYSDAPPNWGTKGKPDEIIDLGKSDTYDIDLSRWAPPTWDNRVWFSVYIQNCGVGRSIEAKLTW